jgi:hypothetical protein
VHRSVLESENGRITLRCVFRKWEVRGVDWIELAEDRGQVVGTCECGNETSGSIKCGEFLD